MGSDFIHTLLYADDLVLIAKDPADLQSQLNALDQFISSLKMEVNMGKTNIMVLSTVAHTCNTHLFFQYKYIYSNTSICIRIQMYLFQYKFIFSNTNIVGSNTNIFIPIQIYFQYKIIISLVLGFWRQNLRSDRKDSVIHRKKNEQPARKHGGN